MGKETKTTYRKVVALGMASSMLLATGVVQPVYGKDNVEEWALSIQESVQLLNRMIKETNTQDYVFLSDLDYVESMTSIGYGSFEKDGRPGGGTLTLVVGGKQLQFQKAIGAHAQSNVVYDLTGYEEYTRFTSYVGLDYGAANIVCCKYYYLFSCTP